MANRYGEAALMAVRMELYGKALTPAERWQDAVQKLYPNALPAQKKLAPRAAFLGLCSAGLVKGIAPGDYAPGNRNLATGDRNLATGDRDQDYATQAVALLRAETHKTVSQLWSAVTGSDKTPHTSQMDVVLALWKNNLIN